MARVTVRVRGWRAEARWRVFVDGVYNNFSTRPTAGLALNLPPGAHRLTADLLVGRSRSARSRARSIRVAQSPDPVLAAAGDIACAPDYDGFNGGRGSATKCHQLATARLAAGARPALVLPLGDLQYGCGDLSAFQQSYNLSWGAFNAISRPVPGNHEYGAENGVRSADCAATPPGAVGYFSYFGSGAAGPGGYYSYDVGSWHVIALNSECTFVGGCGVGSAQELWLRADLAAHPARCTLAYWHEPRWSASMQTVGDPLFDTFWRDTATAGVDLVLDGHDHLYARFTPLDPSGAPNPIGGVRQITVGTGGRSLFPVSGWAKTVEAHENTEYGVLLLTFHAGSYEWQFEPEQGGLFTDYGSTRCH